MTTTEAAAACRLPQPNYSRYENGRMPGDQYLEGIAQFLGITRAEVVLARSAEYLDAAPDPDAGTLAEVRAELEQLKKQVRVLEDRLPDSG